MFQHLKKGYKSYNRRLAMSKKDFILAAVILLILQAGSLFSSDDDVIKVGVYDGKTASVKGTYNTLKEIPDFQTGYFTRINKDNLLMYDVVVIPTLPMYKIAEKERIALNAYAYSGHGVLLCSYSVGGYRRRFKVFPEVATATGRVNDQIIIVKNLEHPVTEGINKIIHSYYDHIILQPGPLGQVLADDRSGIHPEVIVGAVGNKGKVLCTGNTFGVAADDSATEVEGNERKLLVQGIEWLAQNTPKDKSAYPEWEKMASLRLEIEKNGWLNYNRICHLHYDMGTKLDGAGYDLSLFEIKEPVLISGIESLQNELKQLILNLHQVNNEFTRKMTGMTFRLKDSGEIRSIQQQVESNKNEIMSKASNIEKSLSPHIKLLVEKIGLLTANKRTEPITRGNDWFTDKNRFIKIIMENGIFGAPGYVTRAMSWLNVTIIKTWFFHERQKKNDNDEEIDLEREYYELSKKYSLANVSGRIGLGRGYDWLDSSRLRQGIMEEFNQWGKYPGFAGVHLDEVQIHDKHLKNEKGYAKFREYLKGKYSISKLEKLNISLDKSVPPERWEDNPVLWTEWQYFKIDLDANYLKDIEDYLKSIRPDLVLIATGQQRLPTEPQIGSYVGRGRILESFTMDPYNNANLEQAFLFDLIKSAGKGKSIMVIGACYDESPYTYARDLAIPVVHADGLWIFCWPYQSKYRAPWYEKVEYARNLDWTWKEGMWEETVKAFSEIDRTEKYITDTSPVSEVALLFSERTAIIDSYNKNHHIRQYYPNVMGWYQALMESHIQCVPEFAECMDVNKIKRYKVIIAPDARCLSEKEIDLLDRWVKDGGILIATGSTSLFDEWGRQRKDYALKDAFGVEYKDSTKGRDGFTYNHSDIAYDMGREFDTVSPQKAQVTGKLEDGEPAVTENRYGRGKTIFITANKLGLCYESAPDKSALIKSLYKNYLPGVKDFISGIVIKSLRERNSYLPFKVSSCPDMVEVIMKQQPGRYILHFTNYDYKYPVRNVKVEIPVPSTRNLKAFYPVNNEIIKVRKAGSNKIIFGVKEFDIHQAVVIEYHGGK
jgi:hypothetical protein